jgi:hypothetical protein
MCEQKPDLADNYLKIAAALGGDAAVGVDLEALPGIQAALEAEAQKAKAAELQDTDWSDGDAQDWHNKEIEQASSSSTSSSSSSSSSAS